MAQIEIKAFANRSKQYAVTFEDGRPYIVCSVYRQSGHRYGKLVQRQLWQEGDPKMTLTVACAIHAAQRILDERNRTSQ